MKYNRRSNIEYAFGVIALLMCFGLCIIMGILCYVSYTESNYLALICAFVAMIGFGVLSKQLKGVLDTYNEL